MDRLLDVEQSVAPRWTGSTAIVLVEKSCCPWCGSDLIEQRFRQSALFWHGGYGATTELTFIVCPDCDLVCFVESTEVRPDAEEISIARGAA